ncbi:MAG TPA: hypothetical protein VFW50_16055, partial [Streptosporangiaceae bacterium]|nr:hypothetical protein [Streptosporangiaceae bacterium]
MTFTMPVSSSRLRNTTPRAVGGRCRWVTRPATATSAPSAAALASAAVRTRLARSAGRTCATGWVPYVLVAHRSARVSSSGVMAGSGGASIPGAMPGSCPSRSEAAAPAAHSAARLLSPKQP